MKVISPIGARTIRGPTSWYFFGRRSIHTLAGSTTWSSTEMIHRHVGHGPSVTLVLTVRQVAATGRMVDPGRQTMATPPLGRSTWPVMKREASEAR